jgi:uncharacterized 2Fe-2S/4Fe-4S cluster protein (DUF4445 family)
VENGRFTEHGITSQSDHLSRMTDEEQRALEWLNNLDCRLSCQARVQADALIFVPEESRGHKQIIRKSATERAIEIDPSDSATGSSPQEITLWRPERWRSIPIW